MNEPFMPPMLQFVLSEIQKVIDARVITEADLDAIMRKVDGTDLQKTCILKVLQKLFGYMANNGSALADAVSPLQAILDCRLQTN
jgi:hypothetical protein